MSDRLIQIKNYFSSRQDEIVGVLRELVTLETPSRDKKRLDLFASEYARLLGDVCSSLSITDGELGARIRAEAGAGKRTVLILTHMDTVWPVDAPCKPRHELEGNKLFGPGVFDMKAGLVLVLYSLKAMRDLSLGVNKRIVLLATPDEESGSPTSRQVIEEEARKSDIVVVMEPPLPDGSIKTRRKGGGDFRLEVKGREAHAGAEPGAGVNAIHELALQIEKLTALNNPDAGTTVNTGLVGGGTKENVIPGHAWATIDFRAATIEAGEEVVAAFKALRPILPGAEVSVSGGLNRPPMEETPESRALAQLVVEIGAELGVDIGMGYTGGGSDGNFTAAIGVPTVDGMGLDGSGAHASDEHVLVDAIPVRGAILTELLLRA